jgi:hypothetical protein
VRLLRVLLPLVGVDETAVVAGLRGAQRRPVHPLLAHLQPEQPLLLRSSLNPQAFRSPSKLSPPDLAEAVVGAEEVEEEAVAAAAAAVVYPSHPEAVVEVEAVVASAAAQPLARS